MNEQSVPKAKRFRLGGWTLVGAAMLIAGGCLLTLNRPQVRETMIHQVRISESATLGHPGGAAESVIEKLKRAAGQPDYYLHVFTEAGEQITDIKYDTPIGNGLTFSLKTPLRLQALREVQVKHEGWLSDAIVDRVDVTHLKETGQLFTFQMIAEPAPQAPRDWRPITAWSLLSIGGLLVLSTLMRFICQQVV